MNPHSKPRPLIFTPRSPWGRLPLKRTAQSHMRASEDKKPDPSAKDMQGLGGQPVEPGRARTRKGSPGMDLYEDQKSYLRKADDNGVPRSLQGQIIPQRSEEITNPTPQPPLPARPEPIFKEDAYEPPLTPPQTFPTPAGSGVLRPTKTGQQTPRRSEADNSIDIAPQKMPYAEYMNGFNVGPLTFGIGGGSVRNPEFEVRYTPKNLWKTPKK